jgi:DNA-binding NtrC family response regulator
MVDDDPSQLRIREIILRSAGLIVHIATGMEGALNLLRSAGEKFGVVITDHYLDGHTGAELVRQLRMILPTMPVVVLSGMPGLEEEYDGLNVSIRLKPFPPDELIRVVQDSLTEKK